ncbi:unnamed protein product [Rotaria sordida]|uniref:Uncharacterized protein n=1 Tax=Rotaria sordida TaxID=392033 RepID=A0A819URB5_9BILA|nr:unnamed protein product [Rotaria sordida]
MPVPSSTDPKIYSHMNGDEFFDYLKKRFNETFAIFICKELQIITPSVLVVLTIKELNDLTCAVYPDLKSASKEYYISDHTATNGNHELKQSSPTITTTSNEMSDDEVYVNKIEMNLSNDKLIGKRKYRHCKVSIMNLIEFVGVYTRKRPNL